MSGKVKKARINFCSILVGVSVPPSSVVLTSLLTCSSLLTHLFYLLQRMLAKFPPITSPKTRGNGKIGKREPHLFQTEHIIQAL